MRAAGPGPGAAAGAQPVLALPLASADAPPLFLHAPRTLFAWRSAQPRGPPPFPEFNAFGLTRCICNAGPRQPAALADHSVAAARHQDSSCVPSLPAASADALCPGRRVRVPGPDRSRASRVQRRRPGARRRHRHRPRRPRQLAAHAASPPPSKASPASRSQPSINATDSEDALKYFPSLLVRKRYIGDYNHAVLASRASGTGNSARSLVYADGILLSQLAGQRRDLHAALGPGDAGGNRTCRRAVRPVLGGLSRQLRRRRGGLHDAHAGSASRRTPRWRLRPQPFDLYGTQRTTAAGRPARRSATAPAPGRGGSMSTGWTATASR